MSPTLPLPLLPDDGEAFHHAAPRPHPVVHPQEKKAQARASAGLNERIALGITRLSSSMWTVYFIVAFIATWILLNTSMLRFDPLPWALLLTLVNLPQLPMQFVLMVGQSVLDKKQETLSVTQFEHTEDILHDMQEVMAHLAKQDRELLKQDQERLVLGRDIQRILLHVEALVKLPDDPTSAGTGDVPAAQESIPSSSEDGSGSKHLVRAHLRVSSGHAKKGARQTPPPPVN